MSAYVVDASVAAAWFLNEEQTPAAMSVLGSSHELHAPDLLFVEMDSILLKRLRRGDIDRTSADDARSRLGKFPIATHNCLPLLDSAYATAVQARITIYDALYVALASAIGGKVVTADQRLCRALAGGPYEERVLWVEDFRE